MKGITDKNRGALIFILLTIFGSAVFFCLHYAINPSFASMDYIWNYGFSAKINAGLMPYRDFNLLQTPLSFYITALFLNLFGNYFLVYAITGGVFISMMFYAFYKIILTVNQNNSDSLSFLIFAIIYAISSLAIYNYNTLSILIIFAMILIEFNSRISLFNNLLLGVLLGLLFLTKQNIFAFVVLMSTLNILVSRTKFREKFKILSIRGGCCFCVIGLYLLYLYSNGALYQFIDYAFLGIADFSDKNKLMDSPLILLYCIIPAIVLIKAVLLIVKERRYGLNDRLFITLFYALGALSMIYPLFDLNHLTMGFLPLLLLLPFVYSNENILNSKLPKHIFIICFVALFGSNLLKIMFNGYSFYPQSNHYQHVITQQENLEQIIAVNNYIRQQTQQGNNIVILDTRAMAYFSELDVFDSPFDMLVQGNLGYKGEEKISEQIKRLEPGTLFLIGESNRIQELLSLKSFAVCHYDYIGKVAGFLIYRKPALVKSKQNCEFGLIEQNV